MPVAAKGHVIHEYIVQFRWRILDFFGDIHVRPEPNLTEAKYLLKSVFDALKRNKGHHDCHVLRLLDDFHHVPI